VLPGLTTDEQRDLIVSVGTHRGARRLSPVEVAELFGKARRAGASLDECGRAAGFSSSTMVSRFLRLLTLNPRVRHVIDWGASDSTIAFSAASELAKLPDDEEQLVGVDTALTHAMTSAEIKQVVQNRLRSGKPIAQALDEIVRLRPQVERRHVFVGAVTSPDVRNAVLALRQAERDALLARAVRRVVASGIESGGRLGLDRFTLAGSVDFAAALTASGDFEERMNAALAEELRQS